jgi:hypothetical protein
VAGRLGAKMEKLEKRVVVMVDGHEVEALIFKSNVELRTKFDGYTCFMRITADGREFPYYGGANASAITHRLLKGFFSIRA